MSWGLDIPCITFQSYRLNILLILHIFFQWWTVIYSESTIYLFHTEKQDHHYILSLFKTLYDIFTHNLNLERVVKKHNGKNFCYAPDIFFDSFTIAFQFKWKVSILNTFHPLVSVTIFVGSILMIPKLMLIL